MRTIAVLNQKGGVGKTTTVVNTAAALAATGSKVIAIDFDPQAHLTIHLGIEPASIDSGAYKVLTQSASIESEIMMVRPNLWLLPANIDLVGAESELVSVVGREIILREALEACKQDFDYCIIDCAPSLGLLTLNALAASQEVLIPLQPHFLALQGFGKLLQTVEIVNRRINPGLKVNGILLCMFDSRASLPNEVKADIERFLHDARGTNSAWSEAHVFPILVRRNIKLAEAPSYGQTIFEYENSCHGAEDYQKVADFIHAQSNPTQETVENIDTQKQVEQSVESEMAADSSNEEPDEYYVSEEIQQGDLQNQEQSYEQSDSEQNDYSTDINEIISEDIQIQEVANEPEIEVSIDYQVEEQSQYSVPEEAIQGDESQVQNQQVNEESDYTEPVSESYNENLDIKEDVNQPEQINNQSDYSSEIPKKPPFEIREIPSNNSYETDKYTNISEEEKPSDQTNDYPPTEQQGY